MKEENILQLIISSENLPIIDPDLERQHFNSPSRGYHAYMNIWILLIEDESLICRKKKGNEYDFHAVVILEITMLDVCPKTKVIIFGNSYLCLRHQFAFGSQVKKVNRGADYGTEIPVCFIFQGHVKGIAQVKKKIEDAEKMGQSRIEKCLKNALYMTYAGSTSCTMEDMYMLCIWYSEISVIIENK